MNNETNIIPLEQKSVLPSAKDLIKRAYQFYRSNIKSIALISVVPFVLSTLAALTQDYSFGGLVAFVAGIVGLAASIAFVMYVLHPEALAGGVKKLYSESFKKFFPFIWICVLGGLVVWGGMTLFVVPGFFMLIMISFAAFAYIDENRKGMSALMQSWHYMRGYFLPVLGRFAVLWLLSMLAFTVVTIIASALGFKGPSDLSRQPDAGYTILTNLVDLFFAVPFMVAYVSYMYNSLKTIKTVAPTDEEEKKSRRVIRGFLLLGIVSLVIIAAGSIYFYQIGHLNFDEDGTPVPTLTPNINS